MSEYIQSIVDRACLVMDEAMKVLLEKDARIKALEEEVTSLREPSTVILNSVAQAMADHDRPGAWDKMEEDERGAYREVANGILTFPVFQQLKVSEAARTHAIARAEEQEAEIKLLLKERQNSAILRFGAETQLTASKSRVGELEEGLRAAAAELHHLMRVAEMSSGIMLDKRRTGNWPGAEKTADAFDRIGLRAAKAKAALSALLSPSQGGEDA